MKETNTGNKKSTKKSSRFAAALAIATPLVMLGLLALGAVLAVWRLGLWVWKAIGGN